MSTARTPRPLVAIAADRVEHHGHATHAVLHGYVDAVARVAGALPLALPAAPDALDADSLIETIDGLVLTGSPSNVAPQCYGSDAAPAGTLLDPERDATVLGLLPRLIAAGVPVLGVCRGFQELNVAYGGTLDTRGARAPRAARPPRRRPRPPCAALVRRQPPDRHRPRRSARAQWTSASRVAVNSLHHQGVARLGRGLRVEATAPDGLVEAFSVEQAPAFALAVQWHPEMRTHDCPLAHAIFAAFGAACRQRRAKRLGRAAAHAA